MVITITCPSCSTSFPVDPAKIPEGGVNARCSSCGDVLRVEKPTVSEALAVPRPTSPTVSEVATFEAAPPAAEPEAKPAVTGFTFGKRDPADKARRLARVLVSDMIMYNTERHQSALAAGTLVQDFEEEIDKSWKEFVEQVGSDLANGKGRGFWTQALNDILAKGQEVF